MTDHATHCKDPHCYGCSCTPDCDYWIDEPNVLAERERIIAQLQIHYEQMAKVDANDKAPRLYPRTDAVAQAIALIKGETEYLSP